LSISLRCLLRPHFDRLELAPVDRNDSPREKVELTAQHDEPRAGRADRRHAVAAEVGDRLEVGHQSAGQPHELDVALGRLPFEPPARLDAIEIAVEVDLQKRRYLTPQGCQMRYYVR
jgi:hypothetical protein